LEGRPGWAALLWGFKTQLAARKTLFAAGTQVLKPHRANT
jgi:hypothetical protein